MTSKKISKESETKSLPSQNVEETERPRGPLWNTIVRFGLVAALVAYMLKPYLFDKPQSDAAELQNFKVAGKTMGTDWSAVVCASPDKLMKINFDELENDASVDSCEKLLSRIIQRKLDRIDALASTYRSDSEVSKFNAFKSTEWFDVSPEIAETVALAQEISKKTNGAFDVTVAPLVNLYRFGPDKTPLTKFPSDEEIEAIRRNAGYDKLEVRTSPKPGLRKTTPELTIDLSGVAKGGAVDAVGNELERLGLTSYLVEVGGETRFRGQKVVGDSNEKAPWVIGIETPEVARADAIAELRAPALYRKVFFDSEDKSGALATSGDYRNFLQADGIRFSHIVDPRTGRPTEIVPQGEEPTSTKRLGSVSIISNSCDELSCAATDAYATAFFVLGVDEGLALADRLNIPVLFLTRADDSALEIEENTSKAFETIRSEIVNRDVKTAQPSEK